jgi:hypothetical protein
MDSNKQAALRPEDSPGRRKAVAQALQQTPVKICTNPIDEIWSSTQALLHPRLHDDDRELVEALADPPDLGLHPLYLLSI